jgi:hypothetical protein
MRLCQTFKKNIDALYLDDVTGVLLFYYKNSSCLLLRFDLRLGVLVELQIERFLRSQRLAQQIFAPLPCVPNRYDPQAGTKYHPIRLDGLEPRMGDAPLKPIT